MKYTCIYCKQDKDEKEFNREHVVPRMMGRYMNGLVLSDHQVCEQCNSYFSKELEDKIALDSYEALLKMHSGTKKMSDGRRLRETRLTISGNEDVFKGLKFTPIADSTQEEGVALEIKPCVGFKVSDDEYEYFDIEEIPEATKEDVQKLKDFADPVIQFGYEQNQVMDVLKKKGYVTDTAEYSERNITEKYREDTFVTSIKFSVDSIVKRVCAKTIFNFLCWNNSAEYMLNARFDPLREYIRNGTWSENLWFRASRGFVTNATPPNETAHAVGTMLYDNNGVWELLGCITWFGEITYILKVCELCPVKSYKLSNGETAICVPKIDTPFKYFDNATKTITDDGARFIYNGR